MRACRDRPSSLVPIWMILATWASFFIASTSAGESFLAVSSETSGPAGIVLAPLSTRPYGRPRTRPTSRTTDLAAIVPNVMIWATFSFPYFCRTYSITRPRLVILQRTSMSGLEMRSVVAADVEGHVEGVGNGHRVADCRRIGGEDPCHLVRTLDVEIV